MTTNFVDWTYNGIFPKGIIDLVYSFYGRKGIVPNGFSTDPAGTIRPDHTAVTTPGSCTLTCYAINTHTYQWKKSRNGTTWTDLGETTNVLSEYYNYQSGDEGEHWYKCICIGYSGRSETAPVKITVSHPLPSVTITADHSTITGPGTINFSATATRAESYQWQKDGIDIPGATAATYTENYVYGQGGTFAYTCKATGLGGTTTSAELTVTVQEPLPTISVSPETVIIDQGATVTLTATATYTESYQCYQFVSGSWVEIAGATGATYTTVASPTPTSDTYHCIATGLGGTATSNDAIVVTQALIPTVSISSDKTSIAIGETVTFTATYHPATATLSLQEYNDVTSAWEEIASTSPAAVSPSSAGSYRFKYVANNYVFTAESSEITITVTEP